ncbi:hypothetical protein ACGYLX_10240 [Sulfitobacter sp. 1A13496]|uniref:hypothetical protein n=1 Tax=Sulfitobacter sp. 1A13496 TaxID=3368596 RepID=UPI00374699E7
MRRHLSSLSDDPGVKIDNASLSIEDKISTDQLQLMRWALQCLIEKYQAFNGRGRPVDWTEWKLFLQAGYVCGFVCNDLNAEEGHRIFRNLLEVPSDAEHLTVRKLRALVHYIIRSERWGDAGGDKGAITLWEFLESDAAKRVCERLSEV